MIGQFSGDACLLDIAVEAAGAERQVFACAVAAEAAGYGVFDVVERTVTNEVGDANLFACIEAAMVLLLPKFKLQDISIGRGDVAPRCLAIELDNFFGVFLALRLAFAVHGSNGCALVGIVQLASVFNMYLRLRVDDFLAEEPVDDLPELMERAHGHGISDRIGAWASQLKDALIRMCIRVSLRHGRMIEAVSCAGLQLEAVGKIIFEGSIERAQQIGIPGLIIFHDFQHLADDGVVVCLPNLMSDNVGNLGEHDGTRID